MRKTMFTILLVAAFLLTIAVANRTTPITIAAEGIPKTPVPCQNAPAEYRDLCLILHGKISERRKPDVRIPQEYPAAGEWKVNGVRAHGVRLAKTESGEGGSLYIQYRDIKMLETEPSGKTVIYLRKD
ncbi:MAG: hypothetical protein WAU45_21860 [Blastocatellia bacterium]